MLLFFLVTVNVPVADEFLNTWFPEYIAVIVYFFGVKLIGLYVQCAFPLVIFDVAIGELLILKVTLPSVTYSFVLLLTTVAVNCTFVLYVVILLVTDILVGIVPFNDLFVLDTSCAVFMDFCVTSFCVVECVTSFVFA